MHKLLKSFGFGFAVTGAILMTGIAVAAESGRAGYNVSNVSLTGNNTNRGSSTRMPTMPNLPINTVGNTVTDVPSGGNGGNGGPIDPPVPPVKPECEDGGVKNSTYTVEHCMNDVLSCINNGALPNGLNDMFNEDLRNSIINGMNLCYIQVEKCVTTVRQDCRNVYRAANDVWWDFNSRKVQPEYYSFILRKTGLTPNQAENTCWLLDKNTYGAAFNAVANDGTTTSEYANRVGAYNMQNNGSLSKANPQGVQVNNNNPGVDGQRGHYARWDATTGECLIRVAAYNKDSQIKNSWLFGAAGNDKPAEVWQAAGSTFACNKDLFGFGLMNKTNTAAVVGIGGGTVLGAGIGAIAGHTARDFTCTDKQMKELTSQLRGAGMIGVVNEYLKSNNRISSTATTMTDSQCRAIVDLYNKYIQSKNALEYCYDVRTPVIRDTETGQYLSVNGETLIDENSSDSEIIDYITEEKCSGFTTLNQAIFTGDDIYCNTGVSADTCLSRTAMNKQITQLDKVFAVTPILIEGEKGNMGKSIGIGAATGAGAGGVATMITAFVEKNNINCRVGDDLERVNFGKSHSLGSLKDYYVKWNLRLPDTIMPTAQVNDCTSWKAACGTLKDFNQCRVAQINYKPAGAATNQLVNSACALSGSVCAENYPVAVSYGACK